MSGWEQMLGQLLGMASRGVPGELVGQLRPWMASLGAAAFERWGVDTTLLSGASCEAGTANRRSCGTRAVSRCQVCEKPACLEHARPSCYGEIICERCVFELVAERRYPPRQERRQRAQRTQRPKIEPETAAALLELGLLPAAQWTEIHARFRILSAELHPDKFPAGTERHRAQERYKRVTAAYELLKERRAA